MDKSCNSSSADSTTTTVSSSTTTATTIHSITNNRDNNNNNQFLRNLNKFSHTISKPIRKPTFNPPPPPPPPQSQTENLQQHQPPVYNINKSDFRDVVQKLTGSPAHERFSTPPPIQQPKPPSSRLQRIRPPPLAQISNRPPPLLNCAAPPQPPTSNPNNLGGNQRAVAPLSPLPPFPAVHAAAESPISAYMRFLQNSISTVDSDPKRFSCLSPLAPLVSPRWSNPGHHQPPPVPSQNNLLPSPTSSFQMPTSPLPFGCFPSPRSPYPLFSPSTAGQLGFQPFPVSPRVPVPSPRWKDL